MKFVGLVAIVAALSGICLWFALASRKPTAVAVTAPATVAARKKAIAIEASDLFLSSPFHCNLTKTQLLNIGNVQRGIAWYRCNLAGTTENVYDAPNVIVNWENYTKNNPDDCGDSVAKSISTDPTICHYEHNKSDENERFIWKHNSLEITNEYITSVSSIDKGKRHIHFSVDAVVQLIVELDNWHKNILSGKIEENEMLANRSP